MLKDRKICRIPVRSVSKVIEKNTVESSENLLAYTVNKLYSALTCNSNPTLLK